ncbi:HAD family hydrolase [Streptosporangium canum]|uniref:HAD family hydrolase n=1 Tax=Streptosporangium canum TaxID=324952 RepID=UPI003677852C
MTAKRLVLWDIDHTLIETGGVGGEVFALAFQDSTGVPMTQMAEPAGRTEPVIFRETATLHGIEDPDRLFDAFSRAQAQGYADRTEDLRRRGRALPGAQQALVALAAQADIVQSVLTGNTRPSAQIKLAAFGLDEYPDFTSGAYGDDDDTRAKLVPLARSRAAAQHRAIFDRATTILIGDTPSDVQAAIEGGAMVIAVASGKSTVQELVDAGATVVLQDLTDTREVIKNVLAAH